MTRKSIQCVNLKEIPPPYKPLFIDVSQIELLFTSE